MADRFQPELLILGAIGVIAETSHLQRASFNRAFEEAGVDWHWDAETYGRLLEVPGGQARIARYAEERGETVDAAALHAAKLRHFAEILARDSLTPRPGIPELVAAAKGEGMRVAMASATDHDTVTRLLDAMRPEIEADDFAVIGHGGMVANAKPAPDIYTRCLESLGVSPGAAVAVEDTPENARAAVDAGIMTYAYPGKAAEGRGFRGVMAVLDFPDPVRILALDPATGTRPITEGERRIDS